MPVRISSSSSTTITSGGSARGGWDRARSSAWPCWQIRGTRILKVVPSSSAEATWMSPPWALTI